MPPFAQQPKIHSAWLCSPNYANPIQAKLNKMKKSRIRKSVTTPIIPGGVHLNQQSINVNTASRRLDADAPCLRSLISQEFAGDRAVLLRRLEHQNNNLSDHEQCMHRKTLKNKKIQYATSPQPQGLHVIVDGMRTEQTQASERQQTEASDRLQTEVPPMHAMKSSQSLRKLALLERKSSRKDLAINFYAQEYQRRKEKYDNLILSLEESNEEEIGQLEEGLMQKVTEEKFLDADLAVLSQMCQIVKQSKSASSLQVSELSLQSLILLLITSIQKSSEGNSPISTLRFSTQQSPKESRMTARRKESLGVCCEYAEEYPATIQPEEAESLLLDETLDFYINNRQ